ncbi:MAG: response regulator [Thiolinea sp.]
MPEPDRILIIEDDIQLAELIREYLEAKQFLVATEHDGAMAVEHINTWQPDLVILDLMLPGKDGISICREARFNFDKPILMLTASDDDVDQILGLEIGADDFVRKPVEPRILLARIRALFRRSEKPLSASKTTNITTVENGSVSNGHLTIGDLVINSHTRTITLKTQELDFTTPEFDVMLYLAENAGKIISRDELFKQLRNLEYDGQSRFIDITVSYIRKKLGDSAGQYLKTVRGKGYLVPYSKGSR